MASTETTFCQRTWSKVLAQTEDAWKTLKKNGCIIVDNAVMTAAANAENTGSGVRNMMNEADTWMEKNHLFPITIKHKTATALYWADASFKMPLPNKTVYIVQSAKDKILYDDAKFKQTEESIFQRFNNAHAVEDFAGCPLQCDFSGKTSFQNQTLKIKTLAGKIVTNTVSSMSLEVDGIFSDEDAITVLASEKKVKSSYGSFCKDPVIHPFQAWKAIKCAESLFPGGKPIRCIYCIGFRNKGHNQQFLLSELVFKNGVANDVSVERSVLYEIIPKEDAVGLPAGALLHPDNFKWHVDGQKVPAVNGAYLVSLRGVHESYIGIFDETGWHDAVGIDITNSVYAWTPMPVPYQY